MTTITSPPLIEAIFELRWGEVVPGQFSYTPDEQSLFAGKISASAALKGYGITENIQQNAPFSMPMFISHRFRKQGNEWPCFQLGLGVFTVNQVAEGYDWSPFKDSIKIGLAIYNQAEANKLESVKETLTLSLRYHDAFFPKEDVPTEDFLKEHFNVNVGFPENFLESSDINRTKSNVDISIDIETINPKGMMIIRITNAIINDQSGLLMETIVHSKLMDGLNSGVDTDSIMAWLEQAHDLQKHSFAKLVNWSPYPC